MIHDLCRMFPTSYATPHRVIFLTLLTGRTAHAGYLLRYPADLGQPGQGGPGHDLGLIVIFGELADTAELGRTRSRS